MTLTTKLVIRIFDASGQLLGWCQHAAAVKGDGCLRAASMIACILDVAGTPHEASVHWADLNIETRIPVNAPIAFPVGAPMIVFRPDDVIIQAGAPSRRLPPVTVKTPVSVSVPVGHLGSQASLPGSIVELTGR